MSTVVARRLRCTTSAVTREDLDVTVVPKAPCRCPGAAAVGVCTQLSALGSNRTRESCTITDEVLMDDAKPMVTNARSELIMLEKANG